MATVTDKQCICENVVREGRGIATSAPSRKSPTCSVAANDDVVPLRHTDTIHNQNCLSRAGQQPWVSQTRMRRDLSAVIV